MKKNIGKNILEGLLFILIISSCNNYNSTSEAGFNFIFTWGIMDDSSVNTYNKTYTQALDWDNDTTIMFKFSEKEMNEIFRLIKKYEIDHYPELFIPTTSRFQSPQDSFFLEYQYDNITKKVLWDINGLSQTRDAKKLRKIFNRIISYVQKDERIRNLPDSKRAYL